MVGKKILDESTTSKGEVINGYKNMQNKKLRDVKMPHSNTEKLQFHQEWQQVKRRSSK